ncbi:hypothetical protein F5X97DRAFT_196753 [Nemania serpens]|nr:hypothetical protein F5X97DRAFT_196753 [Nemania serpens]
MHSGTPSTSRCLTVVLNIFIVTNSLRLVHSLIITIVKPSLTVHVRHSQDSLYVIVPIGLDSAYECLFGSGDRNRNRALFRNSKQKRVYNSSDGSVGRRVDIWTTYGDSTLGTVPREWL